MNERIIDVHNATKEINCNQLLLVLPSLVSEKKIAGNTCIIGISGASASGKSTVAKLLENAIQDSKILNIDDYLKGWSIGQLNHDSGDSNKPYFARLNPEVYDLQKLFWDLQKIKQGKVIDKPSFNELTKEPMDTKVFDPPQVLILEGIYSLESPFLEIGDIPILVEANLHDRLIRKIVRNSISYKQNVDEIISTYLTNDEPTYPYYRNDLRDKALLIVNNPLNTSHDFEFYDCVLGNGYNDHSHIVIPKKGNGILHFDEKIRIVHSKGGCNFFQYVVRDKLLVNAPISSKTIALIGNYYDIY